jgi:hypothetical protein
MEINRVGYFEKPEKRYLLKYAIITMVEVDYNVALLLNANRPTNFEVEMFDRTARHQIAGIPFALLICNHCSCGGRAAFHRGPSCFIAHVPLSNEIGIF